MGQPSLDTCPVCGGSVRHVRESQDVRIGTRSVSVDAEVLKCADCEEVFLAPSQMDELQRRASETIRRAEGLMMPEEIRELRESFRYTQAEFEHLLGVGPKTVVRWERGTVFQNAATDTLLRVLANVPGAAQYLARERGLAQPCVDQHIERPAPAVIERNFTYDAPKARKPGPILAFSWTAKGETKINQFDQTATPVRTPKSDVVVR